MSNKKRIKNFKSNKPLKKRSTSRNYIKSSMDRWTSPAVHRSRKRALQDRDALLEITEYLNKE